MRRVSMAKRDELIAALAGRYGEAGRVERATDIASGWTECAPLLVREQHLLTEVLKKLTAGMQFGMRPAVGAWARHGSWLYYS
jgi:hypothetical protein